jgi:hypothetical protein
MHLLLVTFSLRDQSTDYSSFFVALRGNAVNWWHFIEQTCIVSTNHDAGEFTDLLLPYINPTDSLLVAEIDASTCQGWLPEQAWKWIRDTSQRIHREKLSTKLGSPPPRLPR